MTNVAGCSSAIRCSRIGCKKTAWCDKLYGALVWQLDNRTSKAASTRVISLTTFEGLTFVSKIEEGKGGKNRHVWDYAYVILECSFDSSPRSLYVG